MYERVQILSITITAGLFGTVFELVRRRRLMERYALLWLFCTATLLGLSIWRGLLETIAVSVGIYYPPSALFAVAFAFILVLLLHFSIAVSRLSKQNVILAQKVGLLQHQVDRLVESQDGVEIKAGALGTQHKEKVSSTSQ